MAKDDSSRRRPRKGSRPEDPADDEFASLYDDDDDDAEVFEAMPAGDDDADDDEVVTLSGEEPAGRYDELFDDEDVVGEEVDDSELFDDDEPPAPRRKHQAPDAATLAAAKAAGEDEDVEADDDEEKLDPKAEKARKKAERDEAAAAARRLRHRSAKSVRPGDRDAVRSPIVLSLLGGGVLLGLVGVTLWFLTHRNKAEIQYQAAADALDAGKYEQSELMFEKFIQDNATDKRVSDATIGIGRAKILKHIEVSKDWVAALEAVKDFRREFREYPQYADFAPELEKFAERIAVDGARDAERQRLRKWLPPSQESFQLLQVLRGSENPPVELERRLTIMWQAANDAINKQESYDASVATMQQALASKPPEPMLALRTRREFLLEYPSEAKDRTLRGLLQKTQAAELALVQADEPDIKPLTSMPAESGGLILAEHTRTRLEDQPGDRLVYTMSHGSVFGIETITGTPRWRYPLGPDAPFFPKEVSTATPGVLVFATNSQELTLLNAETGAVQWRLPLPERRVESPLVDDAWIYLPTTGGSLYKIDLQSGRVVKRLTFSQAIVGPPVMTNDEAHLIIVGDRELAYTVAAREFNAVAVAHVGHRAGSIDAPPFSEIETPMMPMGSLMLLAENLSGDACRLRVLSLTKPLEDLPEVATAQVQGTVHESPALRGNLLFVPSGTDRLTAFAISDDKDQPPIRQLAVQTLRGEGSRSLYLNAASGGEVWLASDGLYRLELNAESLTVTERIKTEGVASQPLMRLDDTLFLSRKRPYSTATLFTPVFVDSLTGNWGVTLGSQVLGWGGTDDVLLAANEDGRVFRISAVQAESLGNATSFVTQPVLSLRLSDDVLTPVVGAGMPTGQLVVAAGGGDPRCWVITAAGQTQQEMKLTEPPEASPAGIADGAVLPMPQGRLQFIPLKRGAPSVDDFRPNVATAFGGEQKNAETGMWIDVQASSAGHVLALDSLGNLRQIQYRDQPSRHLFGVRNVKLDTPSVMPMAVTEEITAVADAGGQLLLFDTATLQPRGKFPLTGGASNAPWIVDGIVFAETDRGTLHAFSTDGNLKLLWTKPSPANTRPGDQSLAGPPAFTGETVTILRRNGDVDTLDRNTGELRGRKSLRVGLSSGLRTFAGKTFALSVDGTLVPVPTGETP